MPKHLFLCRHAETYKAAAGQKDFDRELTPAGVSVARQAGIFIRSFGIPLDIVVCSLAIRTRQTAEQIVTALAYNTKLILPKEQLFDAPAHILLQEINNLGPLITAALVVGHNPSITEVVNLLTGLSNSYVPAGGCTYITFEAPDWQTIEWCDIKYQLNYS